jgi:hypothetical protein
MSVEPASSRGEGGRLLRLRRAAGLPAAVFALLAGPLLAVFHGLFRGQLVEMMDFLTWSLPARVLWRRALLEGRLQQWNPYADLGASTLYAPVPGALYPPNLLLLVGPAALALSVFYVLHLLLAGLGGYALARRLGCRPPVAVCAGLAWELGYQLWMWGEGEKVLTGAWVPWAALGLAATMSAPRWRSRALVGAAAAFALIVLAGDPFLWLHAGALGLVLAWLALPGGQARLPMLMRVAGRLLAVLGLAALLAAPQLVPLGKLLEFTTRAGGLSRAAAEIWSLEPMRLADLIAPGVAGSGLERQWCAHLYFGTALILCVPLAGRDRKTLALAALAVTFLLLALGRHTPVHDLARRLVFPLKYMRFPEKHALVLTAALGLLGALGLERMVDKRLRLGWLAAPLLVAAVIAVGVDHSAYARAHEGSGILRGALSAAVFVCALIVARWRPLLAWIIPVTAALELVLFAAPKLTWLPASVVSRPPDLLAEMTRRPSDPPPRVLIDPGVDNPIPPNTGYLFDLAHVYAHETARNARVARLLDAFAEDRARAALLLDIAWHLRDPEQGDGSGVVDHLGAAEVVRLSGRGRLHLVERARIAGDNEAISRLTAPDFDPTREAILAPDPAARAFVSSADGACRYKSFAEDHSAIECHVSEATLLVIAEAYAPGWTARVDGRPAPLLRADVALRAVEIGKGDHVVEMSYRTPGLFLGLGLGGLGIALAAVLLLGSMGKFSTAWWLWFRPSEIASRPPDSC